MLPCRAAIKGDVSDVQWLRKGGSPPLEVVVVVSEEAHVDVLVKHLLDPFGVGGVHFLHPGEEALHEIMVVAVGPGDVVEVHVWPWHDVELACSTEVDLHARAVAPDELGCHQSPVVVVVYA